MKKSIKILVSFLISMIPFNRLKILLYNLVLGYKIDKSCKIGFLNIIACNKFILGKDCSLGNQNHIVNMGGGNFSV